MSDRVAFIELSESITDFKVYKLVCRYKKYFRYGNDLVLDSVKTYFLEVGSFGSIKRATIGV